MTGAPFPNDDLVAGSVVVSFSANGGAASCTTAAKVEKVLPANGTAKGTWRISFQVPSFLSGDVQVTISGLTAKGLPFSSSNSSQLKIIPAN